MSYAQPKQYFASDAIEWEELPSLAGSLAKRLVQRGSWQRAESQLRGANDSEFMHSRPFASPWDNTMPAALDPAPMSMPFTERLEGLAIREVLEPEVFAHFFGPNAGDR